MCRFIETLCIQRGEILHPYYHQQRMNHSRQQVLGIDQPLVLNQLLKVPEEWILIERVKCRIVYSKNIEEVTFAEYLPRRIRSLCLITHHNIQYDYKFADRRLINQLFSQRGESDDILIVKNGLVTDTSYSNVAFFDSQQWFTPHQPLLPGTTRARLLNEGVLKEREITPTDLSQFSHCSLINAMLPLGECMVHVNQISR
ncbi:MAG: aminotransferase class IV family protein [Bacteroidota bacterium]